jgi:hypothetical protein
MRIIPFPSRGQASADEAFQIELEAALNGAGDGSAADHWRELREDVRALAPAMDPAFERQLRARISEGGANRRRYEASSSADSAADTARSPLPASLPHSSGLTASPGHPHRRLGRLRGHRRLAGVAGVVAAAAVIAVAVVVASPRSASTPHDAVGNAGRAEASESASVTSSPSHAADKQATLTPTNTPASSAAASAPGREQQLAASITLASGASEVQATADRVTRLVVSEGGFVQNSHVQVQQGGPSEAELTLKLPSAKLNAAMAALAELAPVHAESQSLQDITNSYQAARRALADDTAERQALLRALATATSLGQIDSLRAQLSQARAAIAQARSGLQAVSQRASNAEVEVSVSGDAHSAGGGPTLQRGLHDVGRVLIVTLVVLLIAIAVLVPLALLLTALFAGRRALRRYQRERALDPS